MCASDSHSSILTSKLQQPMTSAKFKTPTRWRFQHNHQGAVVHRLLTVLTLHTCAALLALLSCLLMKCPDGENVTDMIRLLKERRFNSIHFIIQSCVGNEEIVQQEQHWSDAPTGHHVNNNTIWDSFMNGQKDECEQPVQSDKLFVSVFDSDYCSFITAAPRL